MQFSVINRLHFIVLFVGECNLILMNDKKNTIYVSGKSLQVYKQARSWVYTLMGSNSGPSFPIR